jgi:sugar-specific transcriptional regulator TrmB
MILDTLKNAGLTPGEITIYESLLDRGGQTAGQIIRSTKLKRGDCYNKIYDLISRGLVSESVKSKKKFFELSTPDTIESYIEKQIEKLNSTQKEIQSILPGITSSYNLAYHKPGVKFFEGEEAISKIYGDVLNAKSSIMSFVDVRAIEKYASDFNKKFIAARKKAYKKKLMIVSDNTFNRKYFTTHLSALTDVRFVNYKLDDFYINFQIYDNKISYITVLPERTIGVIIEDPHIAKMHRMIFEYSWKTGKK